MAQHSVDVFTFQFWRSEPPMTVHYQGQPFSRIGVDNVGVVRTGIQGKQFQAVVDEDVISYQYAMGLIPLYHALPNTGPKKVVYNSIDYQAVFSHLYLIDAVEIVSEKDTETYRTVFARHGDGAARAVMVGNSLKSDIVPAIEAGSWGIHVPHDVEWELEYAEAPTGADRFRTTDNLAGAAEFIRGLS